jgi:thiamine biosynthesis lipoprotein
MILTACSRLSHLDLHGATMGTTWTVKLVDVGSQYSQDEFEQGIQAILDDVNAKMSTYKQDSELSLFNQSAPGNWFAVSKDTWQVVKRALEISEMTGGSFDITVGPLVNLWGFGPEPAGSIPPTAEQIKDALDETGYQKVQVSEDAPYAIYKDSSVSLDLSAIAKGFAVDKVADFLESRGVKNYMVEVGGELRVKGYNRKGTGWRIAIESPQKDRRVVHRTLEPGKMGVATSGDYRNYFEQGGDYYSHTIDPATGHPVTHSLASVTVLMPTALDADALATAFSVMGDRLTMQLAEQGNIPVFLIVKEEGGFREVHSRSFQQYLDLTGD